MDIKQGLKEVRALLARGWCQGTSARNIRGFSVSEQASTAVAWCVAGACYRICDNWMANWIVPAIGAVVRERGFGSFSAWNDAEGRTQAEVLALLDEVIDTADTKGGA